MRSLYFATIVAFALTSAGAAAASSWQPATATSVNAGVNSSSTFVVQAYVTLPNQCYAARIVSSPLSLHSTRHFTVLQMAPASTCAQKSTYHCSVTSPSFRLPIPHKFEVVSEGHKWEVHLGTHAPAPMSPSCRKS